MSSQFDAAATKIRYQAIDPANRLRWRFTPRRLEVEAWRDAVLAVSGQLIDRMGGPATARAEVGHKRRTMYSTISRREPDKMLVAFDFPDANVTTERRNVTTVPQQQLFVLNSDFMSDAAAAVARKVTEEETGTGERVQLLYKLIFCREPTRDESVAAEDFVQGATKAGEGEPPVWNQLVQAMLAANEFCWID